MISLTFQTFFLKETLSKSHLCFSLILKKKKKSLSDGCLTFYQKKEKTSKTAGRVRGWSCPMPGFSLVLEAPLTGEELEGLPQGGYTSGKFPGGLVPSPRLPEL